MVLQGKILWKRGWFFRDAPYFRKPPEKNGTHLPENEGFNHLIPWQFPTLGAARSCWPPPCRKPRNKRSWARRRDSTRFWSSSSEIEPVNRYLYVCMCIYIYIIILYIYTHTHTYASTHPKTHNAMLISFQRIPLLPAGTKEKPNWDTVLRLSFMFAGEHIR